MDPAIRKKCLKLIEKITSHSIADIFISPVDPVLDNVPDYPSIIKHPSDLTTVKQKLISNEQIHSRISLCLSGMRHGH